MQKYGKNQSLPPQNPQKLKIIPKNTIFSKKNHAKSEKSSNMSHDLGQPPRNFAPRNKNINE